MSFTQLGGVVGDQKRGHAPVEIGPRRGRRTTLRSPLSMARPDNGPALGPAGRHGGCGCGICRTLVASRGAPASSGKQSEAGAQASRPASQPDRPSDNLPQNSWFRCATAGSTGVRGRGGSAIFFSGHGFLRCRETVRWGKRGHASAGRHKARPADHASRSALSMAQPDNGPAQGAFRDRIGAGPILQKFNSARGFVRCRPYPAQSRRPTGGMRGLRG